MRFGKQFQRRKGAGTLPLLGSDGAAGTPPTEPPNNTRSNGYAFRPGSNQGYPVHRVGISYAYSGGGVPPATLPCELWVFDHLTERWYAMSASVNIALNRITFFDVSALIDAAPLNATLDQGSSGAVEVFVMVQDAAAANGTYIFGVGADLTPLAV